MSDKKAPIESQVAVMPAIGSDPDVYINEKPLTSQQGIRAVFGGSLISQALSAASATVSTSFKLASSQSSFLLPVKSDEKVIYRVERIADGRTFATRVVRVFQGEDDRCKHIAIIAFQNLNVPAGNVLNYAIPMPDTGGLHPNDITAQKTRQMMAALVSKDVPLLQMDSEQDPFDWRPLEIKMADDPSQFRQRGFVRSKQALSTDSYLHPALWESAARDDMTVNDKMITFIFFWRHFTP